MDWNALWNRDLSGTLTAGPSTQSRLRVMMPLVKEYGRRGGSFLDVGCGTGALLSKVAKLGVFSTLSGVDVADLPLETARAACPEARLHLADICEAPLPERFDLITCMMTLDLVPDERRAAGHLAEMTAPGGHLIVVVQHLEKYRSNLDQHYGVRRHDSGSLTELFSPHGLRPVRLVSWGWPLFDVYYRLLDRTKLGVSPASAPSPAKLLMSQAIYNALRLDDFFTWAGRGRVLFGVFRK